MKRIIALLLSAVMLATCFSVIAFAETTDKAEAVNNTSYESLGAGAVTLNCQYSEDRQKIELSGNVNYNVLVSYGKYSLGILRIKPSQSVEEAIRAKKPDIPAQMNIATRFSFSIDIKKTSELFSKYAVIIISPEGDIILASTPTKVGVATKDIDFSRENFKGLAVNNIHEASVGGDMGFGSAIIPVYYDRLINTNMNGYMYPHENAQLFFDKTYIDELDAKIRTYSVSGARVYLQLLMPKTDELGAVIGYEMPDVYKEEALSLLYTYVRFLSSRYKEFVDGRIGGFIVGKQIDKEIYNWHKVSSIDQYAEKYAFYVSVVANTARLENPQLDIVVPFSDLDCYNSSVDTAVSDYLPTVLIEKLAYIFDRDFSDGLKFNIMIESDASIIDSPVPDDIEQDTEKSEKKYRVISDSKDIDLQISELSRLNTFLSKMDKKYRSAPSKYIFLWNIPKNTQGYLLECSYAYSYYSLIKNNRVSSYVISFSENDFKNMDGANDTVRRIDTKDGAAQCKPLLKFFGIKSWSEIVKSYDSSSAVIRNEYKSDKIAASGSYKGSFPYFDFSTGELSDWYGGAYSKSIKADYGEGGQRVLRQLVERPSGSAHSDLLCIYEYNENYSYTPAIAMKMKITDGDASSGAIYEITVTMGKGPDTVSEKKTVRSGEIFELWMDVSAFSKKNMADYLKISTRCITGELNEYSLWVYDISGYSTAHSNEKLDELISNARRDIRDQLHKNENTNDDSIVYWIVFSIILAAAVIGGIIVIVLRRDDIKNRKR